MLSKPFNLIKATFFSFKAVQTLRRQYLLRVRLIPSILTGSSLVPLRKLHSESRLQKLFKKAQPFERADMVFLEWKEFYTRARAIRNKGSCRGALKKLAKEEPVDLFKCQPYHAKCNRRDLREDRKRRALQLPQR